MLLNSDGCIAHSSITGCENGLRRRNPCQEAVLLASGRWKGTRVEQGVPGKLKLQRKANGPEGNCSIGRPLVNCSRQVTWGSVAHSTGWESGNRFQNAIRKQARHTENTHQSVWLV